MFISSGIEIDKYDKTVELIGEQLEKIKKSEISEEEIRNSKNSIINSINSVRDSLNSLSDFYYSQGVSGVNEDLDSIMKKIENVEIKDVVEVSFGITLDTVYFLRN
jgi:predicted Zn-dependent peptidase